MSTTHHLSQGPCPLHHERHCQQPSIWPVALHSSVLIAFLAASSVPTPLYRLYQQQWGFSATLLTVVFAAYALALLLALLVTGRLSDHAGRRPVISLALALQLVSMVCFLCADGVHWLIAARVVQGFATGMATAAVGAALLDLGRERGTLINSIAPMVGMAAGALGSTALMVYVPWPLHTVYGVLLGIFLVLLGLIWLVPETTERRLGAWASLKPRITVPPQARKALLSVTPANVAVWMLGGFYLSLMPSLIVTVTKTDTPWLGGLVVAALTLTGAVAVLIARKLSTFATLLSGELALMLGLLIILLGANLGHASLLLGGSIIAGFGFGASFLGAVRSVLPLAQPHERAGLMGVFYIESYLANSVPTIAIGYLAQRTGLLVAVNVYGLVIAVLAASAIALLCMQARNHQEGEKA
ncbi:MFS transporter [Pseudomonas sp. S 311-6]|uniref:MFS transporter n=1 Tax=Pseudomonas TaxID=286 RepID=UPI0020972AE0|nr:MULTISPECIES: MFS transporter [Pseudomonas]MCO7563425.1 MFS transporter [Pseudomonas mosselii]MCO7614932.1 MFS transporter [Pseudomonas guariconensis]MCO7615119.1 MFS transporter [Pseudomonas guariconensis]MCO7636081.1 MFS transporter [Pseudomonas sp. S 311-6]